MEDADGESAASRPRWRSYVLYSVVIHSGTSSQYGHYYSISRHSDEHALVAVRAAREQLSRSSEEEESNSDVDPSLEAAAQAGPWFCCNDSRVTESSFTTLSSISQTFPSDVPYLLFYRSLDNVDGDEMDDGVPSKSIAIDPSVLRAVQIDNQNYIMTQEQAVAFQRHLSHLEHSFASNRFNRNQLPSDADMDPDMA